MKNVMIVGGAGFVGRNLLERLRSVEEVESVIVYDRAVRDDRVEIFPINETLRNFQVRHLRADAGNLEQLKFWMSKIDTVFHLAANADISKAANDPTIDFKDGTVLTNNVLEAMRSAGTKTLVYFSGSGVYGENAARIWGEEDGPLRPISPYGASKLASEALINAYSAMFGLRAIIMRPANLVGPGQTHGVGLDFIRQLVTDPKRLEVLGNGSQTKSYLWIDDAINAVLIALRQRNEGTHIFNIASEDEIRVKDIAELAARTMDATPIIHYGTNDRGWKGDVPRVKLLCDRIRSIGWRPRWNSWQAMQASLEAIKRSL